MMTQQANESHEWIAVQETAASERARGTILRLDTLAREITVLLATGLEVFYIPPNCPIVLHGERIKLRMIQPRDKVRVTFVRSRGMLIVELLEVQPDCGFSCFRL